jgi:hypothetical protein
VLIETTRQELRTRLADVETPVWRRDSRKVGTLWKLRQQPECPPQVKPLFLRGPIRKFLINKNHKRGYIEEN